MEAPANKPVDGLLSAAQVAQRLHVSQRHVARLVNTGAIPILGTFGTQHQLVFREEDVEQYEHRKPTK